MHTYELDVAGLKRSLPICRVTDDLYIGAFVIFGDVELFVAISAFCCCFCCTLPVSIVHSQGGQSLFSMQI